MLNDLSNIFPKTHKKTFIFPKDLLQDFLMELFRCSSRDSFKNTTWDFDRISTDFFFQKFHERTF